MPGDAEAAPWRDRRFVIFSVGNFANNLGEGAYKVALPLYVYELTGSLVTMSLIAALSPVMLLAGPWFGAMVDRFGSRVFVVPGLMIQLVAAVALNSTATLGLLSLAWLFVLAALIQLGGELYRTGWIAGVPRMFPDNAPRCRALLSSLFVVSNVVGPLVVAVGLGWVGYLGLLWFNAATFLAPVIVWLIGIHPPPVRRPAGPRTGLFRDIVEGWRIVRGTPEVFRIQLMTLPLHFVSGIGVLAFLVWYLRDHMRVPAETVGLVQTAFNIGALVGSLFVATRVTRGPERVVVVCAFVMTGALFAMAIPSLAVLVVVMVAFFMVRSAMTAVSAMIMVKHLPADVIGRAEGLFNLISGIPVLAAPLIIPVVQGAVGARGVLIVLGVVSALSLLGLRGRGRRAERAGHPAV